MEFKQAHRLENLHVSGTRVVFGKCAELAAQGIPVTALTLGQPDFDTPQYIIDACKKALDEGKTRYTDGSGIQELKEAVCQKLEKENGLHYTPSEISVTTGVAQGMFVALLSTLNPGDEVLVPDPVYLTYSEIPNIAGAVIKKYDLLEENDYQVDVDQIRSSSPTRRRCWSSSPQQPHRRRAEPRLAGGHRRHRQGARSAGAQRRDLRPLCIR